MIPQRIKLKGFLCYKDEQHIDFDSNATLWMLSGLNGSGKSSIFDAVTFSLFGHHRGGAQQNQELINKDSDGSLVEFDFCLDKRDYRAKRTLKRDTKGGARGTQQLFRFEPGTNGEGKWTPIEDTGSRDGFNAWINNNIGLNYETFTSSVLLEQGKAQKLLDSKPGGRHDVLASIVDLERYVRLHAKADEQRKTFKAKCDTLSDHLKALPEVKAEQIAEAADRICVSEAAREQARQEVERLRDLEHQARGWLELQGRITTARQQWERARLLLDESATIQRDMERWCDLRDALPRLTEIANCRTEIHNAQAKIEALNKDCRKAKELLAERTVALEQARSKRESIQKMQESEESKHRTAHGQLLEAKLHLDRLEQHEFQESEFAQVRDALTRLPAAPEQDVLQARETCDRLVEINRVAPLLERFGRQRDELRQAVEREAVAQRELEEIKERGNKHKAEIERLAPLLEEAKQTLQHASDQAAEARTLVKQASDSLKEAEQLKGAAVCRHCGQKLTPGHIDEEKRKRGELLRQTQAREEQAKESLRQAQEIERRRRNEHSEEEKNRTEARIEYGKMQGRHKQTKQEIDRLRGECLRGYDELPEAYRTRISVPSPEDWLTTTYPAEADLQALRAEGGQLPAAQARLKKAEDARNEWTKLKAKGAAHHDQLCRLAKELPADRQAVRTTYVRLDLDVKTHEKTIETYKANLKTADKDIDRLAREREQADGQLRSCETQVRNQELTKEHAQNSMQKQMKVLPAVWQGQAQEVGLTQVHQWESEKADLEAKRTAERHRELQHARDHLDGLGQEKERLERQQAEFPEEARRDPATIKSHSEHAKQVEGVCTKDLDAARQTLAQLQGDRERRQKIGEDMIRVEGELRELEILTKLLGRDRLQLHLVQQAEKQVVAYANTVLDRLSGGQLDLRLKGEANGEGASAKALELEAYNRVTGEKPINVAFLSGSQKFRVAVSLALGIGQYASRQHRPIESVIIDEGFGCLDSQGRQVMIQELQNLRSQMRCILLVSHQEEFAEAFSDGYHFKLESGATRVERFQK
ncbi:MAG TPA: SMC family ATPase [Gemmataceae bacterium]|jgi:exonuclease SbcC